MVLGLVANRDTFERSLFIENRVSCVTTVHNSTLKVAID